MLVNNTSSDRETLGPASLLLLVRRRASFVLTGAVACTIAALTVAFLLPPVYTAETTFVPPQQPTSAAASALSSLGGLAGLAGLSAKTTADQYVSLLQSRTVADRIIKRFELKSAYGAELAEDARRQLAANLKAELGKKDGLIRVSVDDHDPQRAAQLANAFVDELRSLANSLALSEAKQRREFFEALLRQSHSALAAAQQELQSAGFTESAIRTEPRAAADAYSRLKAEVTAAEVRLSLLAQRYDPSSVEFQQAQRQRDALLAALRKIEDVTDTKSNGTDYVTRYREYKYQETLVEVFSRQYEVARVDESRESGLVQVIDQATAPERKSSPRRALIVGGAAIASLILFSLIAILSGMSSQAAMTGDRRHE